MLSLILQTYVLDITESDINLYGEADLTVENGIKNSFSLETFPTTIETIDSNGMKIVATVPDSSSEYSFYWYIDGVLHAETSNKFILSESLLLGKHFVDVLASKDGALSSNSTSIAVREVPDNYAYVEILEPGDKYN